MQRVHSIVLLSVAFFFISNQEVLGQCPAKAILGSSGLDNSGVPEILVYDSFDAEFDITAYEVNIYDEVTGNYLVTESSNFPVIGDYNDIRMEKRGNTLRILGVMDNVDLLRCIVVVIGEDCPVKKINITER